MRIELTQQSGLEVNQLSAADMTPAMAAQYLSGTIHLRSFWEMLRRYYPAGDLRDRVVRAVAQPGDDPKSTVRRVRNWEQGKNAYQPGRSVPHRLCPGAGRGADIRSAWSMYRLWHPLSKRPGTDLCLLSAPGLKLRAGLGSIRLSPRPQPLESLYAWERPLF